MFVRTSYLLPLVLTVQKEYSAMIFKNKEVSISNMLLTIQKTYFAIAALFLLCSIESCFAFLASSRSDACSRTNSIRRQEQHTKEIFPSTCVLEEKNVESEETLSV